MRQRKSKKAGKTFIGGNEISKTKISSNFLDHSVFATCLSGHVTIEVDELSDSQEKEESKKSGGPGQFLLLGF